MFIWDVGFFNKKVLCVITIFVNKRTIKHSICRRIDSTIDTIDGFQIQETSMNSITQKNNITSNMIFGFLAQ